MQTNLAKFVFIILSVFLLKITVADTLRDESRAPSSTVKVTSQGIR